MLIELAFRFNNNRANLKTMLALSSRNNKITVINLFLNSPCVFKAVKVKFSPNKPYRFVAPVLCLGKYFKYVS